MNALDACLFDVSPEGTIFVPNMPEPRIRADVFELTDLEDVHTCAGLVSLIENCAPLTRRFRALAGAYLAEHTGPSAFILQLQTPGERRTGHQKLILQLIRRDPEDGWQSWIEYSGDEALEGFLHLVHDWLAEDIDWSERGHFEAPCDAQQAAFLYFEREPQAFLKALGVEIVEGDVPGSDFCAARLTKTVTEFNQVAELLELDCRFRSQRYHEITKLEETAHD